MDHSDILGLQEPSQSEPVSTSLQKVWLFSFSQCIFTMAYVHRSLWDRLEERLILYIFDSVLESFPKETLPPLHSRGSESVNWLKSGNWLRCCESLFWLFKLDFCSFYIEHFCLYWSNKNFTYCLSISFPEILRPIPQVPANQINLITALTLVHYSNHTHLAIDN